MRLARLLKDSRGAALLEFALAMPVLLIFVLGGIEIGHTMYVRSILIGQLQKAGRDMGLEDASATARMDAIQARVRAAVRQVMASANVDFTVNSFHDYKNAAHRAEEFGDADSDGLCNHGETFVDSNGNGHWDSDGAVSGRGGAKDVVSVTATVTYPRLALGQFFAASPTTTLRATTLLRNQPSTTQSQPPTGTCP